jgi:hypothetical protein
MNPGQRSELLRLAHAVSFAELRCASLVSA